MGAGYGDAPAIGYDEAGGAAPGGGDGYEGGGAPCDAGKADNTKHTAREMVEEVEGLLSE